MNIYIKPFAIIILFSFLTACKSTRKDPVNSTDTSYKTSVTLPEPEKRDPSWSSENSVIVHILADPDNLHPSNGNSQTRAEINLYIHGSLLQTDLKTSEVRAGLCKSLPKISEDQLNLEFQLRDEPKWDDGSPLTAQDVIFTIKAAKCPLTDNPAAKPYFDNVKDVIADPSDPKKFTVIMKKAYIQNIGLWCDYPVIQQTFYDKANVLSKYTCSQFDDPSFKPSEDLTSWAKQFNSAENGMDPTHISGLGPYKLVSWSNGEALTLQKKNNHWTDKSQNYWEACGPEKIIFTVNRDASSQKIAFSSQKYDGSAYLGTRTLFDLQSDSAFNRNYHSRFMDTYGYTYIALNMKPDLKKRKPVLTDAAVRKALAYASPVDDMIRIVNKGINKRVNGPVSFLKKSYYSELPLIPFDPAKANQILDEAGWKDSNANGIRDKQVNGTLVELEIELAYLSTQTDWKDMALIIAEGMAKAGVKVNPAAYDFPVWMEKAAMHDFDMLMGSWNSTAMPDDYAQLWSTASWNGNGPNYTGFGDESTDALIDSISFTFDENKRIEMEKRFQKKVYDEQPYIFMYGLVRRCAIHKRFNGSEFYAERPGILYNILQLPSAKGSEASVIPN